MTTTGGTTLDARRLIDEQPLGRAQMLVYVLLLITFAIDGVDTQITSYLAPAIARDWQLAPASIGFMLSIGLAGSATGALVFGSLGDMLGPKRVIILATLVMGIATIGMSLSQSFTQLVILRFIAGLGLGGSLPNIVALASQIAPKPRRAGLITLAMCGFPVGGTLAGIIAGLLLEAHGWRAVYLACGILPLLLIPLMMGYMAESLTNLLRRPNGQDAARRLLQRFYPAQSGLHVPGLVVTWPSSPVVASKAPLAAIFQNGLASISLLVTAIFVLSLMNLYFLNNWLPTLLQRAHSSSQESIIATTALNFGGVIGTLLFGRLIDRFGFTRSLGSSLTLAALCMLALSMFNFAGTILFLMTFIAGVLIQGGQGALYSLPALVYPEQLRATGTGWATSTGKLGSVIGPSLAGVLLGSGWSSAQVLMLAALAPALAAVLLVVLGLMVLRPSARVAGS